MTASENEAACARVAPKVSGILALDQDQDSNPAPALSTGEATPRVLGPLIQEGH